MEALSLTPNHLGGHCGITHIDRGVFSYLIENFPIKTVVDVGCGVGGMSKLAKDNGVLWTGIEGDLKCAAPNIISHDFTLGTPNLTSFDLGWSVEFVEHVAEEYLDNFMRVFAKCNVVFITHATIGQTGYHHVNCQNSNYWINIFRRYGLIFNAELTSTVRQKSTMGRDFVKRNGLVFIHE